jgi:hypothetical protein
MNDIHIILEDVEHNTRSTLCISRHHSHAEIISQDTGDIQQLVNIAESLGCEGIYVMCPATEVRGDELIRMGFLETEMKVLVWKSSRSRSAKSAH